VPGTVDLNADCGEGDDDAGLLAVVTSANVACGGHAGDPGSLRETIRLAVAHGVAIGAQVSYEDREGFGRRDLDVDPDLLRAQILWQAGGLDALCRDVGTRVRYVKPHGALYHRVLAGGPRAQAVVTAVRTLGLPLLLMPGASWDVGGPTIPEGFADRAYDNGKLRSRDEPGAVLSDPGDAAAQAVSLAQEGMRSLCVHGDSPGAVRLAQAVRAGLTEAGWTVAAFA
jgi:UPF0271 protein